MSWFRIVSPGLVVAVVVAIVVGAVPGVACAAITGGVALEDDLDLRRSVVKIYSQYNRYNYHQPWQKHGQRLISGSGCVIAGKRILTSAHIVSDNVFIQVRRAGSAKKYTATIEAISHERDLAVLNVEEADFFNGLKPFAIGELPHLRDKLVVYGFPDGGDKLSLTEGVVSRIEHTEYFHSGAYLLTCQIDASINSGNSGGPVVRDGRVIGVAFQGMSAQLFENIGYMVPAPVIRHFLRDIEDGRCDGTPSLGIAMQKMENPDLRHYYGLPLNFNGAMISRIFPGSSAVGLLEAGDIVLAIDNVAVENDGTVEFRPSERTFLGYIAQKKQLGEQVTFRLWRQRQTLDITVPLTRAINFERLIPHLQYDTFPDYHIVAGLVFCPVTLNYLNEFSAAAPTELLHYFYNGEIFSANQQLIVLSQVLADAFNIGYHGMENVVIAKVNGRQVRNMSQLRAAFAAPEGDFHVIEDLRGFQIVLSAQPATAVTQKILKRYSIPGADPLPFE